MKNIFQNQKNLILMITSAILFVGCAPKNTASLDQAAQSISDSLGCANVQSKVFDSFYELLDQNQSIPLAGDLKDSLQKKLAVLKTDQHLSKEEAEKLDQVSAKLLNVVDLMLSESVQNPQVTSKEQIQKLIEYEMEDQSSPQTIATHSKVNAALKEVRALSAELPVSCANPDQEIPMSAAAVANSKLSKGLDMVFATAYQSCRVLDLPPMDSTTPNIQGVTRVGTHSDGIGGKRLVTDVKAAQNSHYYMRGIASESSCTKTTPLIYDYGGKVFTSGNTISFFKNAGSGTEALGVDCSGYVAASIAVGGLRYKPGLANKPIYANQGASKYMDAAKSGFTCFENVTVTPLVSIKEGDVVGVSGHVLAIDKIGADPFALANIKTVAECSTLNYKNFDIVIVQSSPSKGGIGMNKYKVKDYLAESSKMKTAFVEMGKNACLAKFQYKWIKPASSDWGFVRHKRTAECVTARAVMEGESCTKACL
ncbi:MAG: hypothetical protein H7328_08065 [Bdellovibrio sp.]|nr:hypothetical protein [Bdellovibrio sp.]